MRTYENFYPKLRKTLKTGDILLFSGHGIISTAIKIGTMSTWSHVGMVIKGDVMLVWESTTLKTQADLDNGLVHSGVQVCDLGRRVAEYDGEVAVRYLKKPLNDDDLVVLHETRHEHIATPYEEDIIELVKSAYDGPFGHNVEDLSSIFCSELVAMYFKRIGRLPESVPSNEYTPPDFADIKMSYLLQGFEHLKVKI